MIALDYWIGVLGVSFWEYLTDRVGGKNLIPTLGELIAQKAAVSLGELADTTPVSWPNFSWRVPPGFFEKVRIFI